MVSTDQLVVGPREPGNEAFGELLKQYRLQKRLTRAQAAERLGYTSEYLRLIERGKRTPVAGSMPLIFGVYDVNFSVVDGTLFVLDDATVEFTSRIQEARGDKPILVDPFEATRAQQIGQIIELLVEADEERLRRVYALLRS